MKKKNLSIIIILIAIVGIFATLLITYQVNKANEKINYDSYDITTYNDATKDNGNTPDHVKGSKDAPVLLVEYADYQCPGCAQLNPRLNSIVEEYDGKVAIIYRNFLLSYHQNGTAAASAAEAAARQGYWKDYADMLFANQSLWEDLSGTERTNQFVEFFNQVSNGAGDEAQFRKDMASSEVAKKISFDMGIAKMIDVPSTPGIYLDGQHLDFTQNATTESAFLEFMYQHLDEKLKSLGLTPPEHASAS